MYLTLYNRLMSTEGSELELALEDTNFYDFLNIKVIHCQLLIVVGCGITSKW